LQLLCRLKRFLATSGLKLLRLSQEGTIFMVDRLLFSVERMICDESMNEDI
jgi:hypothetical protein